MTRCCRSRASLCHQAPIWIYGNADEGCTLEKVGSILAEHCFSAPRELLAAPVRFTDGDGSTRCVLLAAKRLQGEFRRIPSHPVASRRILGR